ncbi:hypothetical protein COL922a_014780, partial [Colletotrichum nupharicola]
MCVRIGAVGEEQVDDCGTSALDGIGEGRSKRSELDGDLCLKQETDKFFLTSANKAYEFVGARIR